MFESIEIRKVANGFIVILNTEDGEAIIVATITKLLVENFVLNLKVESR